MRTIPDLKVSKELKESRRVSFEDNDDPFEDSVLNLYIHFREATLKVYRKQNTTLFFVFFLN